RHAAVGLLVVPFQELDRLRVDVEKVVLVVVFGPARRRLDLGAGGHQQVRLVERIAALEPDSVKVMSNLADDAGPAALLAPFELGIGEILRRLRGAAAELEKDPALRLEL